MLRGGRRITERAVSALAAIEPDRPEAEENGLGILETLGGVVVLKKGATLFREGDAADCYYKVVSGAVRSCKLLADGRRHITDFFLAGDFIGVEARSIPTAPRPRPSSARQWSAMSDASSTRWSRAVRGSAASCWAACAPSFPMRVRACCC